MDRRWIIWIVVGVVLYLAWKHGIITSLLHSVNSKTGGSGGGGGYGGGGSGG